MLTRTITFICLLTCAAICAAAQAQLSEASLQRLRLQAQELSDATVKGDYATAANLTYPKLIEMMGGRAKYISAVQREMNAMQTDQVRIASITVGEPQDVINVANKYYAIVPTTTRIKVPEGILVGDAYMIAASADRGAHWMFVDSGSGGAMGKQGLRILFPGAADKLKLPEIKRPTLYKN